MNDLTIQNNNIIHVAKDSDRTGSRVLITFKNKYKLSIIRGLYTYGGEEGLLEIAPIKPDGSWASEYFDDADKGNDVLGYLTKERVLYYINKIGNLP